MGSKRIFPLSGSLRLRLVMTVIGNKQREAIQFPIPVIASEWNERGNPENTNPFPSGSLH